MEKQHIILNPGQNLFFTSDMHIGHKNVINFCNRPFENIKDMKNQLVKNWNSVVKAEDIVFNLGDFFWFNDRKKIFFMACDLNGIKYMVPGNHDDVDVYCNEDIASNLKNITNFETTSDIVVLYVEAIDWQERKWPKKIIEIYLCHYPLMTWPHREKGAIQLFGHIHSQPGKTEGLDQDLPLHKNQYDVGVDNNDYKPISLEQVLTKVSI